MENIQKSTDQHFYNCPVCEFHNLPEQARRYTREEFLTHLTDVHKGWALCKGCEELLPTREYEEGGGWCGLCVDLCHDCMDRHKYPEGL
jgi:hypothetical protein